MEKIISNKRSNMINFTNHPYDMWDEKQKKAASIYGDIKEIPFPPVDPAYTE